VREGRTSVLSPDFCNFFLCSCFLECFSRLHDVHEELRVGHGVAFANSDVVQRELK
jgi:hypothetical protein